MKLTGYFWSPSDVEKKKTVEQNGQTIDDVVSTINGMDIRINGDVLEDKELGDSTNNILSGSYPGGLLRRQDTSIRGIVAGAEITTPLSLRSRHIIEGVQIKTARGHDSQPLVTLSATATVVFRNCVFERETGPAAQIWVRVESGAKAVFVGCMFLSATAAASGVVISNGGAAADVQVVASYNGTGIAFAGVTSAALGNI